MAEITDPYPPSMFPPNLDVKYLCAYCKQVMCEPVQCFCGHRFCHKCLNTAAGTPEAVTCPSCVAEGTVSETSVLKKDKCFPDNALKREMMAMSVVCMYEAYGCDWAGTLRKFTGEHQQACLYRPYACQCGETVSMVDKQTHLDTQCTSRTVACPSCSVSLPVSQMAAHQTVCLKHPVTCTKCYKSNIPRDQLLAHMRTECVTDPTKCIFGCAEQIAPQDMDSHMQANMDKHITSLGGRLLEIISILQYHNIPIDTSELAQEPTLADIQKRLQIIEQKIGSQISPGGDSSDSAALTGPNDQIHEMTVKITTFEAIVTVLRDQHERCLNLFEQTQVQYNNANQRLEQLELKIPDYEHEIEVHKAKIAELETRLLAQELISYDGHLIWKIVDFSKRRRDAISMTCTSIYSPPFYTNRTGYKMCTRLYPNGDGMGKDKYVSLFFVVMRGPYDALLPWPFRQKVTFMLLDQGGKDHVLDAFRPDPSSSSFRRPTTEMNIASGCPMFVKLDELDLRANNYVRDDVLFIKIVVAPLEG